MLRKTRNRISAVLAAASVCCFTASVLSLKPMMTKGVEVHNDYLDLKVNDSKGTTDYAGYVLRRKSGDPSLTMLGEGNWLGTAIDRISGRISSTYFGGVCSNDVPQRG